MVRIKCFPFSDVSVTQIALARMQAKVCTSSFVVALQFYARSSDFVLVLARLISFWKHNYPLRP